MISLETRCECDLLKSGDVLEQKQKLQQVDLQGLEHTMLLKESIEKLLKSGPFLSISNGLSCAGAQLA